MTRHDHLLPKDPVELLHVCPIGIQRGVDSGGLPATRTLSGRRLIPRAAVEASR